MHPYKTLQPCSFVEAFQCNWQKLNTRWAIKELQRGHVTSHHPCESKERLVQMHRGDFYFFIFRMKTFKS